MNNDYELYSSRAQNLPNYNEALATSWMLVFNKFPDLIYFAQSVTIPGVTTSGIRTTFKNQRTFMPDNQIEFSDFTAQFIVDEDFANYDALLQEFFVQEKATQGNGNNIRELLHDFSVVRLSSNRVPIAVFKFTDASLNSLGSISYNTTGSEPDLLICDVTFNVTQMYVQSFRKSNEKDGQLTCNI